MRRLAVLACALVVSSAAEAHDWFTAMSDPVTGSRCCGGTDCSEVPQELIDQGAIAPAKDGFAVTLTLDQVHLFNKAASKPVAQHIPWSRVQPSQSKQRDGTGYAICIWRDEIKCFFAPSGY